MWKCSGTNGHEIVQNKRVEKQKTKALSEMNFLPKNKKRWQALLSECQGRKRLLIWDVDTTAHAEISWTVLTASWMTVGSNGCYVLSIQMVCPCWASYFGRTWRQDRWWDVNNLIKTEFHSGVKNKTEKQTNIRLKCRRGFLTLLTWSRAINGNTKNRISPVRDQQNSIITPGIWYAKRQNSIVLTFGILDKHNLINTPRLITQQQYVINTWSMEEKIFFNDFMMSIKIARCHWLRELSQFKKSK